MKPTPVLGLPVIEMLSVETSAAMSQKLPALLVPLTVCWFSASIGAADGETVFRLPAEELPTCANGQLSRLAGALGGQAVLLGTGSARIGARLRLEPGLYTVVFRTFAPSASQDAVYVSAAGQRIRIPIGEFEKWVVRTQAFRVQEEGKHDVLLVPDPSELGVAIDDLALVRGAVKELAKMEDLPARTGKVSLKPVGGVPVARAAQPAAPLPEPVTRDFQMAAVPEKPRGRGLDTLFYASFDESHDADYARGNGRCGVISGGGLRDGKWGQALDCTDRLTNVHFNMGRNLVPRAGTLECWVKSGEANIWADGEDHCLFHLAPRRAFPGGPRAARRVELIKRGADNALHLTASGGAAADLAVSTAKLDPETWHHLAISWDFVASAPTLWLCVDGKGQVVTLSGKLSPLPFVCLEIGNTRWYGHYAHADEYYPLGGLIDDLHISDETLARREAGSHPLDIGKIDVETALCAEDGLQKWLDRWADLQLGGVWGGWITPMYNADSEVTRGWTKVMQDRRSISNKYGSSGQFAHYFLQAYEHVGDEKWLQVATNTAQFFLAGQDRRGYWYQGYIVDESGRVEPGAATNWARVQDQYQTQPWLFLLYMHRVTGDERYFAAARKCADFLLEIENPNGSWPGTYDTSRGLGRTTGSRGVDSGCEYNDCATSDPLRMMITMYHLTGDRKYIDGTHGAGIAGIGPWMFATQIGQGQVRGWCQQYGQDNKPVWARGFEAPVISPRVVCRFIHPMCLWFYLMTGEERYMKLMQETYDWYRSAEVPGPNGGWYYQYLPDGTPMYSRDFEMIRIDAKNPPADAPKPSRSKLSLTQLGRTLKQYQELGPKDFRQSFVKPIDLTVEEIAARRKSAASYCRSVAQRVRDELATQRSDGTWASRNTLRLPYSVATYRYVLNLRLARGVVPPQALRRGGVSPWDGAIAGRGGWRVPAVWVADWFDVPLKTDGQAR